jgi:hypothetical protein
MISAVLLFLAVFFNSVMDSVENAPRFNNSIFRKIQKQFWLKEESWKYAPKVFGWKADAWHIAKSCMVICVVLAIIHFDLPLVRWQDYALYIAVGGTIWNGGFKLFYDILFHKK